MIYDREITKLIRESLKDPEILFLLGTRRTGKTTISKLISKDKVFEGKSTYFFDFEDKEIRSLFNSENLGVEALKSIFYLQGIDTTKNGLLVFDEIQLLDDPSNLLKLIHDHFQGLKVVATGSSSLQIKNKFSDSLAGRKKVFNIQPLSFNEFLLFRGNDKMLRLRELFRMEENKEKIFPLVKAYNDNAVLLFEEYLTYGGYPEVVLLNSGLKKIEKLKSIADSYIKKDIRDIALISNLRAYNDLLKYLAINSGNLVNISSIATTIKLSPATVQKYIMLLKETFIIDELSPFFMNRNKEISKNQKIYYKDIGVRNLQLMDFRSVSSRLDKGILYENYIFNVLSNDSDILKGNYFYRTQQKTEIDFLVKKDNNIQLIEVKSGIFKKRPKAMNEFSKKFSMNFDSIEKLIINREHIDFSSEIKYLPAYLF